MAPVGCHSGVVFLPMTQSPGCQATEQHRMAGLAGRLDIRTEPQP